MQFPYKGAPTDTPVIDVIKNRWSPVIFSEDELSEEEISSLFEAARWAPSSYNEQPWRYIYARKKDVEREKLESLLAEGNSWAKQAGLLLLSFARKTFTKNGKPNRHSLHDVGAASALMTLQATAMGLISHQMAGFDISRANTMLGVPSEFEPGSMIAIGHPGDAKKASATFQERDAQERMRNPRSSFVYQGGYRATR